MVRRAVFAVLFAIAFSVSGVSQKLPAMHDVCPPPPQQTTTCSGLGLNHDCSIVIDRVRPVVPLKVFIKPGSKLTVYVFNSTPLENLSFDIVSTSAVAKPDVYGATMNALSGNLEKMIWKAYVQPQFLEQLHVTFPGPDKYLEGVKEQTDAALRLLKDQGVLIDEIDGSLVLSEIRRAIKPATPTDCRVLDAPREDEFHSPWFETATWKAEVLRGLEVAKRGTALQKTVLSARAAHLSDAVKEVMENTIALREMLRDQPADPKLTEPTEILERLVDVLVLRQNIVPAKVAARDNNGKAHSEDLRLAYLQDAIRRIPDAKNPQVFSVKAQRISKDFDLQQTLALNYTNVLASDAAVAAADPFKLPTAYSTVATVSTPASIVQVSLQYQSKQWIETSAGVIVPFRPFHGYTIAAVASGGAVTGHMVQQTNTYTVVPMVIVSLNGFETSKHHGPWALLLSGGIGYNPATTSVEFGVGPSFAWKSIQLNVFADCSQDTFLIGGFQTNQPLTLTNPDTPQTKTGFGWRGAAGLSVRIPLGGSASK